MSRIFGFGGGTSNNNQQQSDVGGTDYVTMNDEGQLVTNTSSAAASTPTSMSAAKPTTTTADEQQPPQQSKSSSSSSDKKKSKSSKERSSKKKTRKPRYGPIVTSSIDDEVPLCSFRATKPQQEQQQSAKKSIPMTTKTKNSPVSSASFPENKNNVNNNPAENDENDEIFDDHETHIFCELIQFARNRSWKKKLMTAFIVLTSFYVLYDIFYVGNVQQFILSFVTWMSNHPVQAVWSFIAFFMIATLLFVPPAILMFAAGYGFASMHATNVNEGEAVLLSTYWSAMLTATITSFVGSCLGAILAFLRSRYMMRDLILLFARRYPIVNAFDKAFERNGLRVMLLLRLCPIIPFNGLNYIGGVLSISLADYTKALIGILPTVLFWVHIGVTSQHFSNRTVDAVDSSSDYLLGVILMGTGVVFGIVALFLIWKYAAKELKKEMDMNDAESWFKYSASSRKRKAQQHNSQKSYSFSFRKKKKTSESSSPIMTTTDEESVMEDSHEHTLRDYEISYHTSKWYRFLGLTGREARVSSGPRNDRDEDWFWLFA